MSNRLVAAGYRLDVWSRSSQAMATAAATGATPAANATALIDRCDVILLSLANEAATDEVLALGARPMEIYLAGRTVIQLGTTSPTYAEALCEKIEATGGRYVEAPVSGSSGPAAEGTLVGMLAAKSESDFRLAEAILTPLTSAIYRCGTPGSAMRMKLAVNSFLIAMVMALGESWSFARTLGLDGELFRAILDTGPMASAVSRGKLAKLAAADMTAQASVRDVLMNADLVAELARVCGAELPVGAASRKILAEAADEGFGDMDMIAAADRTPAKFNRHYS